MTKPSDTRIFVRVIGTPSAAVTIAEALRGDGYSVRVTGTGEARAARHIRTYLEVKPPVETAETAS